MAFLFNANNRIVGPSYPYFISPPIGSRPIAPNG